jgi:hypothetical protein
MVPLSGFMAALLDVMGTEKALLRPSDEDIEELISLPRLFPMFQASV